MWIGDRRIERSVDGWMNRLPAYMVEYLPCLGRSVSKLSTPVMYENRGTLIETANKKSSGELNR